MTREEAQAELEKVAAKLRYQRVSMIVDVSRETCGEMYDNLMKVKEYIAGPEAPAVRKVASQLRNDAHVAVALNPAVAAPAKVQILAEELLLLCDALLAFTVPTPEKKEEKKEESA